MLHLATQQTVTLKACNISGYFQQLSNEISLCWYLGIWCCLFTTDPKQAISWPFGRMDFIFANSVVVSHNCHCNIISNFFVHSQKKQYVITSVITYLLTVPIKSFSSLYFFSFYCFYELNHGQYNLALKKLIQISLK